MDWFLIFFGLGLAIMIAGPSLLILVSVRRRHTKWTLLAAAATLAGAVWWIELYRVASGAVDLPFDCYSYCSTEQEVTAGILGYLPMAVGAVLVAVLLMAAIGRLRRLRSI